MSEKAWLHIHPAFGVRRLPPGLRVMDWEKDVPAHWREMGCEATDPLEDAFARRLLEHFASQGARVGGSLLLSSHDALDLMLGSVRNLVRGMRGDDGTEPGS